MGNKALQLCIAICVALGVLILGACSGGGGVTNPTPAQRPLGAPAAGTLSLVLTGAVQSANLPSVAGFTESISLPANNAPAGTALSLTVSSQIPSGMPALAADMFVAQPFLYLTMNSNKTVTFNSYPGFTMTLPAGVHAANLPVKVGFFDPATGWKHVGDMTLTGSTAVFAPASGTRLTLNANVNYYALTYTCKSSTLPLAGPGKPMPIPRVGGFDGQFMVPSNNAPADTTVTITSFDVKPTRAPSPQAVSRRSLATLSGGTVLFWISTTYSSSFAFSAFPVMSFDLPEGTNTSGVTFYLETFDHTTLIDQQTASSVSGLTVNFPGTAATFAIATGHTYWWELSSVPAVTEFSLPTGSAPGDIIQGPDANLWFSETGRGKVGRITPTGALTEFTLPIIRGNQAFARRFTIGPDGNLWCTLDNSGGDVGRITTSGVITTYPLPTHNGSAPAGITKAPDGNLWVAESLTGNLARVTTSGVITEFPTFTPADQPLGVVAGPDGNLWVGLLGSNQIARVVISTQTVTRFTIPTANSLTNYIIVHSGALYFEENGSNKIGIITPAGAISEVLLPTSSSFPGFLTTGPDGHVWFPDEGAGTIGTINTAGTVVEIPIPTPSSLPAGITNGPSSTIWFTENSTDKVGEFTVR